LFNFFRYKIKKNFKFNLRVSKKNLIIPIKKKNSLLEFGKFNFLNKTKYLSKVGWNGSSDGVSKLWRYNLHYFDDLNASKAFFRKKWHIKLLNYWVKANNVGKGIGWESYPTSLRIVNWVKWSLLGNKLPKACLESLYLQSRWLNKRVEWHILGNHLFTNAKALIFAGLFFSSKESDEWLKKGLKIINNELDEQILSDGGNFERSPMYHSIFLEDLLDLINISKTYNRVIKKKYIYNWSKKSVKMLKWLDLMSHPDGEISFFNDSAFKIAPIFSELQNYFIRLGYSYNKPELKKFIYLADSGYLRINYKNIVGILDVAKIGPDYIPSHAHADTLSFEISLFGLRFLVNGGTSVYEINQIRMYERSTKAHNTVEINFQNSSEVWSAFRVARRANPFDILIKETQNMTYVSCKHDGYKRLNGKPIHVRSWQFHRSSLIIKDNIEGLFKNAYAYFHFCPSIKIIKKKNNLWNLKMINGKKITLKVKIGKGSFKRSYYSPEFGKRLNTQCLKVSLNKEDGSFVEILW
jgi:uncharacterized heparinase superfamily protein